MFGVNQDVEGLLTVHMQDLSVLNVLPKHCIRSHNIIMRIGIKVPPIKSDRQNLSSNPTRFQLESPPSIPHSEVTEELELELEELELVPI